MMIYLTSEDTKKVYLDSAARCARSGRASRPRRTKRTYLEPYLQCKQEKEQSSIKYHRRELNNTCVKFDKKWKHKDRSVYDGHTHFDMQIQYVGLYIKFSLKRTALI